MEILRGHVLCPKTHRPLQRFWDAQAMAKKAGRFCTQPFRMYIGVTQWDPFYPTLFNIIVDAAVRAVLLEVCIPQEFVFLIAVLCLCLDKV